MEAIDLVVEIILAKVLIVAEVSAIAKTQSNLNIT